VAPQKSSDILQTFTPSQTCIIEGVGQLTDNTELKLRHILQERYPFVLEYEFTIGEFITDHVEPCYLINAGNKTFFFIYPLIGTVIKGDKRAVK
jgi:hypothetical protein